MEKSELIPIFLINGFLGAGKTTYLLNLLSELESQNLKCGVIINEFGDLGIDGQLIPDDVLLVEINSGSIFCQCLNHQFLENLINITKNHQLDVLLIEASGLADPSIIYDNLRQIENQICKKYLLKEIICLIDAFFFLELSTTLQTLERQIKASTIALINKIDLVEPETIHAIENRIREYNPNIMLYQTSFGKFNYTQSLPLLKATQIKHGSGIGEKNAGIPSIKRLLLISNRPLSKEVIMPFFEELKKYTFRIKGFLQFLDGWCQINSTNTQLKISKIEKSFLANQIVVIFRNTVRQDQILAFREQWNQLNSIKN